MICMYVYSHVYTCMSQKHPSQLYKIHNEIKNKEDMFMLLKSKYCAYKPNNIELGELSDWKTVDASEIDGKGLVTGQTDIKLIQHYVGRLLMLAIQTV